MVSSFARNMSTEYTHMRNTHGRATLFLLLLCWTYGLERRDSQPTATDVLHQERKGDEDRDRRNPTIFSTRVEGVDGTRHYVSHK